MDFYLIMALLPFLFIPPLIYYRQKVYKKKAEYISVQCPHCMAYEDIRGERNYTCKNCNQDIIFFDQNQQPSLSKVTYECVHCGRKNFEGMLTCPSCGLTNKAGIPSS